jgi:hypothetical protein
MWRRDGHDDENHPFQPGIFVRETEQVKIRENEGDVGE